jgi:hypothetical protein
MSEKPGLVPGFLLKGAQHPPTAVWIWLGTYGKYQHDVIAMTWVASSPINREERAMKMNPRKALLTTLAAVSLSAGAATRTLSGDYLSVSFDDAALPVDFSNLQLKETALTWTCGAEGSCAPAGPITASIVFGATNGAPMAVTSQSLVLPAFDILPKTKPLVTPGGTVWGVGTVGLGQWSVGIDIASQTPPMDAQFASAYGKFSVTATKFLLPPAPGVPRTAFTDAQVLGLKTNGVVTLGPASSGYPFVDETGASFFAEEAWPFSRITTQLDGARYALPSRTDVMCSSTACMEYQTAPVNLNSYALNFNVVLTPMAVPELDAFTMMALGLGALTFVARRQRV